MGRPHLSGALAALLLVLSGPALAGPRCDAVLDSLGRALVAEAPAPSVFGRELPPGVLLDCTAGQLAALQADPLTLAMAEPVGGRDALLGSWVADDVLGSFAGVLLPAVEVIEIAPGAEPAQITLTQTLLRAVDAEGLGYGPLGDVDLAAQGYRPILAEITATLQDSSLFPTRIRYHDVIIDTRRDIDLAQRAMLTHFAIFGSRVMVTPDGTRLRLETEGGLGTQIRTFRRRDPEAVRLAAAFPRLAEITALHTACLVETFDTRPPRFAEALGETEPADFFALLNWLDAFYTTRRSITDLLQDNATTPARRAVGVVQFKALFEAVEAKREDPAFQTFLTIGQAQDPFGCVYPG
ncbi:MAG: hypothetical protein AAGD12_07520 [Pseudomonadota bacterium]